MANFVETEQLIEVTGGKAPIISSCVVVRGSIPLLWSQIPNIKYKPTTLLAPLPTCDAPFDRHIRELLETYQVPVLAERCCPLDKLSTLLSPPTCTAPFHRHVRQLLETYQVL